MELIKLITLNVVVVAGAFYLLYLANKSLNKQTDKQEAWEQTEIDMIVGDKK